MSSGSIYGLFVGVNRYESEDIRPLAFASADVLAVRDKLVEKFRLELEKAVILADGIPAGKAPTRREILRAMNRFTGAPMGPDDAFFLVFAGHGFVCSGKTFLAAADSEIGSEALLRETAVSLDSIRDFLAEIKAGQHVVILDACRDSPVKGTRSVGGDSMSGDMTRDIGTVIRPASSAQPGITRAKAILCSCWEGQVAYEYPQGGHGWFCHNLLAELDAAASQTVSLADLHGRVKQRMKESAWRLLPSAKDQSPHLLIEGDVPVLYPSLTRVGATAPAMADRGDVVKPASASDALRATAHEPASAGVTKDTPTSAAVVAHKRDADLASLEADLLAGRVGPVLRALRQRASTSPDAEILELVALLARQPVRMLHHKDADEIARRLNSHKGTEREALAAACLRLLKEKYYLPLARRFPIPDMRWDASVPRPPLGSRSLALARVIPELADMMKAEPST
jgi:hypothetical protein